FQLYPCICTDPINADLFLRQGEVRIRICLVKKLRQRLCDPENLRVARAVPDRAQDPEDVSSKFYTVDRFRWHFYTFSRAYFARTSISSNAAVYGSAQCSMVTYPSIS